MPPRAPDLKLHLALLLVQLFFGGFHVAAKGVLPYFHPLAVASLRVLIAVPILMALAWRHDGQLPRARWLPHLALLGLLGVFSNQLLYITGLQYTSATNAAILIPSVPAFTAAVALVLGVEQVARGRLAGIALSSAGALVMLKPHTLSFAGDAAMGNLMVLANCLCYSAFLVLQRPLLAHLPWRTVIAWAYLLGGAAILLVGWPQLVDGHLAAAPTGAWLGVAYIGVFPTALGYLLNTWAVRRSSPVMVAAYTTLQPLLAAALAHFVLKEGFGWTELVGLGLICAGLWVVSRRNREQRMTK